MIIYRYLAVEYLKVFLLCAFSFLGILMSTRLEEIAQFAALGAQSSLVWVYVLYQLPYILPVVLPISGLIASIVLIQRLNANQELTALRASGLSMKQILAPPLFIAAFFMLFNFYVVSELSTQSHLKSRILQRQLTLINPLTILRHRQLVQHKDLFFTGKSPSPASDKIENFILAHWNHSTKKLSLLLANELSFQEPLIQAKRTSVLTTFGEAPPTLPDNIYLENLSSTTTGAEGFTLFMKQKVKKVHEDFLKMSLLITQIQKDRQWMSEASEETDPQEIKITKKRLQKAYSEISRRLSIALATFTFTLMGCAFSLAPGRHRSPAAIYIVIALSCFYLVSFFTAKTFEANFPLATTLYFLPNILIVILSIGAIRRVTRGSE